MPIPGLLTTRSTADVNIGASVADVDLFALLGSPSGPITATVNIGANVVVSSSSAATPAMFDTGLDAGSTIYLYLASNAKIRGAGGDGESRDTTYYANGVAQAFGFLCSAGGGGAGIQAGAGGTVTAATSNVTGATANAGQAGTATAGGARGTPMGTNFNANATTVVTTPPALPAEAGGDGLRISCNYIIENLGQIWGGGGGGGGEHYAVAGTGLGTTIIYSVNGDGGAPGAAGAGDFGAAGGFAVRYANGTAGATFTTGGTAPDVKGSIGQ